MNYLIVTLFGDEKHGRFLIKFNQKLSGITIKKIKQKFNEIRKNNFYDVYELYIVNILNELNISYSIEDFSSLNLGE